MQNVKNRKKSVGKRAPSDEKCDGRAEQKRDAVSEREAIGGVQNRVAERCPRDRSKVAEDREENCSNDDADCDNPCPSVAREMSTMPREVWGMHNAPNHVVHYSSLRIE